MSTENWELNKEKKLWDIDIPRGIDFHFSIDDQKLKLHIKHPEHNMQKDDAAFEGWALLFHIKKNVEVTVSFEPIIWDGSFTNLSNRQTHYMRFLYRIWKFNNQMDWFHIDESNNSIVDQFSNKFIQLKESKNIINNFPKSNASLSQTQERREEHFAENAFVREGLHLLNHILKDTTLTMAFNQLPNGLFMGKTMADIKNTNRIFPTGYFDIWGISQANDLCIFELKAFTEGTGSKNKKVGIISELYFYANYSKDVFYNQNFSKPTNHYNGYEHLVKASTNGLNKIKAYFLAPEYHSRINDFKDSIEKTLNINSPPIEYKFLTYQYSEIEPFVKSIKGN